MENKEPIIYYTGRRAQETPNILAQGLNFCEKYFSEFDEVGWLMDNAFAEGGILIDKDNKKILIFGGGDISYTPALQRLYCKHITKIWKGWNVEWCSKGNVDFAEYLGIMEDRILASGCIPEFFEADEWSYTMNADRTQDEVITIINNGVISDYKQDLGLDGINMCIAKGEILKDIIPEELKIDKWHNEIETTDCLLVDYDTRKIFVCWGGDTDNRHDDKVREIWKGWEVQRQTDGLIFHFDYTNRDRTIIEMTDEQFEEYNLFEFDPKK
ncbi:MAG: hypothetical protein KDC60_04610 [Bacteroidetes bacterium]|nr:hypothetical protein [Bacteroidota bacterium]MCB0513693.1 hypothetical protein [Bacteroidota bacterium]